MKRTLCLILALTALFALACPAQAARRLDTQLGTLVPPIGWTAQSNASRMDAALDGALDTCYSYIAWSSAAQDATPEMSFTFSGTQLCGVWMRSGSMASSGEYYANARPAVVSVRVTTSLGQSYTYAYQMDDIYDVTSSANGWCQGYQYLEFPFTISGVTGVDLFISSWTPGTVSSYNVCVTDIAFVSSLAASSLPSQAPVTPAPTVAAFKGVSALLNQRMATRSGPGTEYDELGSYFKAGAQVTVLTRAWDNRNKIWWVQVELTYGSEQRRVYTGVKRVDVDINLIPDEFSYGPASLKQDTVPVYGPGKQYSLHKFTVPAGTSGTIWARENGYAQFEYYDLTKGCQQRVWLPLSLLNY